MSSEDDGRTPWQRDRDRIEATGKWPEAWGPFHRHFCSDAIHRDGGTECDQPGSPRRVYVFDPDTLAEHEAIVARWAVEQVAAGPCDAETVAVSRADLARVHEYARHFDVDDDPAMVRVAEVLRTSERPPGSSPAGAD